MLEIIVSLGKMLDIYYFDNMQGIIAYCHVHLQTMNDFGDFLQVLFDC